MLNRKNSQFSHNSKIDLLEKRKRLAVRITVLLIVVAVVGLLWQANRQDSLDLTLLLPQELRNSNDGSFYNENEAKGYVINEQSLDSLSGVRYFYAEDGFATTLPLDSELSFHATIRAEDNKAIDENTIVQLFVKGFEKSGFNQIASSNEAIRDYETENNIKRFSDERSECTLDVSAINDTAIVVRACSLVEDVDPKADLLRELYTVYKKENSELDEDVIHIYADDTDIEQSITDGYEYVIVNIGNLEASAEYVFVRSEGGPWQYFGPQNDGELSCEIYQNDIIKQSLAHYNCVNPGNLESSTVKEYFEI